MAGRVGILLTAFGGPDSLESVGPFMARFMGREPCAGRRELRRRRSTGRSAVPRRCRRPQPRSPPSLEHHLQVDRARCGRAHGDALLGAVDRLGARASSRPRAPTRIVMVSLSAFESQVTCEAYRTEAHRRGPRDWRSPSVCEAPSLHRAPQYRDFFGHACAHALDAIAARAAARDDDRAQPAGGGPRAMTTRIRAVCARSPTRSPRSPDSPRAPSSPMTSGCPASRRSVRSTAPVPWLLAYQSRGARPGDVARARSRAGDGGRRRRSATTAWSSCRSALRSTTWRRSGTSTSTRRSRGMRTLGLSFARTCGAQRRRRASSRRSSWAVEPLL